MHTYIQRQNQQVNRRHIKITYLLTAPEPARRGPAIKTFLAHPSLSLVPGGPTTNPFHTTGINVKEDT